MSVLKVTFRYGDYKDFKIVYLRGGGGMFPYKYVVLKNATRLKIIIFAVKRL